MSIMSSLIQAPKRCLAGCALAILLPGVPEAALAAARCSTALGVDCHGNTGWFPDHDKLARVRVGGNWETRICAHGGVANPCHKNKGVTGVTTTCPKGPTEPEILCRRFDAGTTGSDYPVPFATLAELQAAFNSKVALGQACVEGTYRHDASGNCEVVTDGLLANSCTAAQVDVCDGGGGAGGGGDADMRHLGRVGAASGECLPLWALRPEADTEWVGAGRLVSA